MTTSRTKLKCGHLSPIKGKVCRSCLQNEKYHTDATFRKKRIRNSRKQNAKHRDKINARRRSSSILSRYGISKEEYDDARLARNGRCDVCSKKRKRLVLDHDHRTGALRGFVCDRCNVAIAGLGDDKSGIERALRYINGELRPDGSDI